MVFEGEVSLFFSLSLNFKEDYFFSLIFWANRARERRDNEKIKERTKES